MHAVIRSVIVALLCVALALPRPAAATGIPVIDVANLVENVRQAIQTYQQYVQDYEHYVQMFNQYKDLKENWKKMVLDRLLISAVSSRDPRLGYSALKAAQYLNPDSGNWRESVETLLRLHYNVRDPYWTSNYAASRYSGNLGQAEALWQREYREQAPLLDAYHFQAAQEQVSQERMRTIDELQGTLNGLGERSELRQLQAIGSGITVLARQNEASIDAMHMLMAVQTHEQYRLISARQQAREANMRHAEALRGAQQPCRNNCIIYW